MQIIEIHHSQLISSKNNARKKYNPESIKALAENIREEGLINAITVIPTKDGQYEVIAGERRRRAIALIAKEDDAQMVPSIVREDLDKQAGKSLSLSENIQREAMTAMEEYEAFTVLYKSGMSSAQIAKRFHRTEKYITQRLAIADLLPAVKKLFNEGVIEEDALFALTLATKTQQKEWLQIYEDAWLEQGWSIKDWLFRDEQISTSVALFDIKESGLQTVTDLFDEKAYFTDAEAFKKAQFEACETLAADFKEKGWEVVHIVGHAMGKPFYSCDFEGCKKADKGGVYINVSHDYSVSVHKGLKPIQSAAKASGTAASAGAEKRVQPELTQKAVEYVDEWQRAMVRKALIDHPEDALRVLVADILVRWSSVLDVSFSYASQCLPDDLEKSPLQQDLEDAFATAKDEEDFLKIYAKLQDVSTAELLQVLAVYISRSLKSGNGEIQLLGQYFGINPKDHWNLSPEFAGMVRNKKVLAAAVMDATGQEASHDAKIKELQVAWLKVDCREYVAPWFEFPSRAYDEEAALELTRRYESLQQ